MNSHYAIMRLKHLFRKREHSLLHYAALLLLPIRKKENEKKKVDM